MYYHHMQRVGFIGCLCTENEAACSFLIFHKSEKKGKHSINTLFGRLNQKIIIHVKFDVQNFISSSLKDEYILFCTIRPTIGVLPS
jgi:hypothetical protein